MSDHSATALADPPGEAAPSCTDGRTAGVAVAAPGAPAADVAQRRARIHAAQDRPSYAAWGLLGIVAGFAIVAMIVASVLPGAARETGTDRGLLSGVPSEATFQIATSDALRLLREARPQGEPTRVDIEAWTTDYVQHAVLPARQRLTAYVPPARLADTRDHLVEALDRYLVASGAAHTCLQSDPGCYGQMDDLLAAAHDVDRLAGDLRLYTFG